LDRDLQIVLAWTAEDQRRTALTGLRHETFESLAAVLEETVRDLIPAGTADPRADSGIARPVPFLVCARKDVRTCRPLHRRRIDRYHAA